MNALSKEREALRQLAAGGASKVGSDVGPLIRRAARIILVLFWVLGALTAAVSAFVLVHHARTHTESTAISLEQFARRTVTLAAFVVDEYEEFVEARGGISNIADDAASDAKLQALVRWLPEDSNIVLVAADGSYLATTVRGALPVAKPTDRRWYLAHVRDGLQTYVGPAIFSRVSKRHVFTYSAAYRSPDGKLLGIITVGIPSRSVTGLAPDQTDTNMALVQHEGFVIAAQPFEPEMVAAPFAMPFVPSGVEVTGLGRSFEFLSIVTVRNIAELGLFAVVAVPMTDVLQPLIWGVAIGLPLLLVLTQLVLTLSQHLQEKSQQVEQALDDNKVLFQEVHHRVKNNLQVVSSLLRLQIERLPPELRPLLEETGARVRAIALVHEQIYRASSPSDVQLDRFLAQLVQQLSASMIGSAGRITTELQPVTIGLDRAVPVAILATEAVTNAIKHGLGERGGAIVVSLDSRDGRNVITVRDSGKGSPAQNGSAGLGTRIMTALARQIDGAWSLTPEPSGGMVYRLEWPA